MQFRTIVWVGVYYSNDFSPLNFAPGPLLFRPRAKFLPIYETLPHTIIIHADYIMLNTSIIANLLILCATSSPLSVASCTPSSSAVPSSGWSWRTSRTLRSPLRSAPRHSALDVLSLCTARSAANGKQQRMHRMYWYHNLSRLTN